MVEITKDQWELLRKPATVESFKELPDVVRLVIRKACGEMQKDMRLEDDWHFIHRHYDCLEQAVCSVYGENQQTMRAFVRAWLWLNQGELLRWYDMLVKDDEVRCDG